MKKTALMLLCIALILPCALSSCANRAPKTEEIYDRVVNLLEAAKPLNQLYYGEGLPVYAYGSEYAVEHHLYDDFAEAGRYEMVTEEAEFRSIAEIKNASEEVFSTAYLENVLYPMAFDGYAISDGQNGVLFARARFMEDNEWLYRSSDAEDYLKGSVRQYDYESMKVVKPSGKNAFTLEITTLPDGSTPAETVRLRFVKQESEWYLDSFSG